MFKMAMASALIGFIVLTVEVLWRAKIVAGEYARKIVHILAGTVVAFLPYFLNWRELELLGTLGIVGVLFVRFSGLFRSWYDVNRVSWGDLIGSAFFVGLAFFEPSKIVFMGAVLHVSLADGFAAVVGTKYGKSSQYKVLGCTKSRAGTATFFVVSLLIMTGLMLFAQTTEPIPYVALLLVPLATTAGENFSMYGIDNAVISSVVLVLFSALNIN